MTDLQEVVDKTATGNRKTFLYTTEDIKSIVESEGLRYALNGYLGPKGYAFQDVALGNLWDDACDALTKLEGYLDNE